MQSAIIICAFAIAATLPTQSSGLDLNAEIRNLLLQNRPVRQETFPRAAPSFPANNLNAYANVPNGRVHGQNQVANNIQWIPVVTSNDAYTLLSPSANNPNNGDFERALNNLLNIQSNPAPNKQYLQPAQVRSKPSRSNPSLINNVPPNQVHYIAYMNPASAAPINNQQAGSIRQPVRIVSQPLNVNQAFPQANSPNSISFVDLDFNPKNPFGSNENKIPLRVSGKADFNTIQPIANIEINLNTPFPPRSAVKTNQQSTQIPLAPVTSKNIRPQSVINLDFNTNNPFNKNYRDDTAYEPVGLPDPHIDREPLPKVERLQHEKAPVTNHEDSKDIPTKPNYPGVGQWAKFGVKHRPYIGPKHKFATLEESKTIPDGYDVFLEGQKLFDFQNNEFGKKLQEFPHNQGLILPQNEEDQEEERAEKNEDDDDDKEEDKFVPTRLYAQVRQTEDEKHLPPAADENGKLKELVKDSKSHTIYSEEGYEDSAYDHAGHEKSAENAEGQVKDNKAVDIGKEKNAPVKLDLPERETKLYVKGDVDPTEQYFKFSDKNEREKIKDRALELDEEEDDDDDEEEEEDKGEDKDDGKGADKNDDEEEEEEENEDSKTEATEYDKSQMTKVKPPKKVYSAKTKDANKYKIKMDDFIEGKGTSPMATIIKGDGNTDIEISSEIKVIVQPNNTTRSHKYVKIYPKYRPDKKVATEIPFTTLTPSIEEIFTVEIPATTQATTAIPKRGIIRKKRFANGVPKIEIDTDFIDKIDHNIPKPDKEYLKVKYPYYQTYKKAGIDENSPLRYSENPNNIPDKSDGGLTFYSQADRKKECPDVNSNVDPLPDRIKKADENPEEAETGEVADLANSPRLTNLGDKIDCFKSRYFGENPFDNPIFTEQFVGQVKPIFDEIEDMTKNETPIPSKKGNSVQASNRSPPTNNTAETEPIKSASQRNYANDVLEDGEEENYPEYSANYEETGDEEESKEEQEQESKGEQEQESKEEPEEESKEEPEEESEEEFTDEKEFDNDIKENFNPKKDAETVDVSNNNVIKESPNEVVTLPPATLITTPKYTIDLKPKHIYDQIELLQYLPGEDPITEKSKSSVKQSNKNLTAKKSKSTKSESNVNEKERPADRVAQKRAKSKQHDKYSVWDEVTEKITMIKAKQGSETEGVDEYVGKLYELSEEGTQTTFTQEPRNDDNKSKVDKPRRGNVVRRKPRRRNIKIKILAVEDMPKTKEGGKLDGAPTRARARGISSRRGKVLADRIDEAIKEIKEIEPVPRAESLTHNGSRKKKRRIITSVPGIEIFDINPFIPTIPTPHPPYDYPSYRPNSYMDYSDSSVFETFDLNKYAPSTSTVLPKFKVASEVSYKDDINPSEQLNVFTDVFNHINNDHEDIHWDESRRVTVPAPEDPMVAQNSEEVKTYAVLEAAPTTASAPKVNGDRLKNHQMRNAVPTKKPPQKVKTYYDNDYVTNRLLGIKTTHSPIVIGNTYVNHDLYHLLHPQQINTETNQTYYDTKVNIKRKEENSTTTTTATPIEAKPEDKNQTTEVMGLVPPNRRGYKTIYNPKRDNSANVSNEEIEVKKINKFIVLGMKPPPEQKVIGYSEYLTANHIQSNKRPNKHRRRHRRSASRPSYAGVDRSRGVQVELEKKDTKADDDDYVPHRSKNYHYDENTGRIIYDKKPEEEESEEVEYVEVTEETPPSTTSQPKQNPIFATATPPPAGQSYVDFVKLLKSANNYHEIPDPTTTEKGSDPTTETAPSATIESASTSPPEFLSILAKVRSDSNYKLIEDKKEKTKTTTTPQPIEEEEYVEEAEEGASFIAPIQNSPGSTGIAGDQTFKLFDINDFLPNVKSYLPQTPVDTSKYTSIERPVSRHNLSSRYNSEEDKNFENINTSRQPLLDIQDDKPIGIKEIVLDRNVNPTVTSAVRNFRRGPSTTAAESTTKPNRGRGLGRRRSTVRSSSTTPASVTTGTDADRSRRNFRRRPLRARVTTTTEKSLTTDSDPNTPKIIRRRSQRDSAVVATENNIQIVPKNQTVSTLQAGESRRKSRRIVSSEENANDDIVPVVQKVVNIFKNYDKIKRHGGNLKTEDEVLASENRLGQSQRNRIGSQNEDVDVFKKYDKTKKHGGNYRAENEGNEQLVDQQTAKDVNDVEVIKDYDKTKKHGGNYRREHEEPNDEAIERSESEKSDDVETFKDYDKAKKHGGNYRREDEIQHVGEPQYEESRVATPTRRNQLETHSGKAKDVDTFKEYDKTKKHGGNYISEEDANRRAAASQEKGKDIEIFNNYDKKKKHGGNYRPSEDAIIDTDNDESYDKTDSDQKVQKRDEEGEHRSPADVVVKPETFYTDPKLPVVINGLKIVDDLSHDEIEEIVASAEEESSKSEADDANENANVSEDSDKANISEEYGSTEPSTTTKKPLFIKDPSQRLYFYAPLR